MREIQIRDVGPIHALSIPIPTEGGVVVLSGLNGQGKSRALAAVQRLTGAKADVVARDGMPSGSVEGLGVRLTVGRRTTTAGELELAGLEGEDPSKLVDPGIKDPIPADAARIKALVRLARVNLSLMDFAPLVKVKTEPEMEAFVSHRTRACVGGDPVELARSFEGDLHKHAKALKDQAEATLARASGIRLAHQGLDVNGPTDVEALEREEREASEDAVRLRATFEEQTRVREAAAKARAELKERYEGQDLKQVVEEATEGMEAAVRREAAAFEAVSKARNELKLLEQGLRDATEAKRVAASHRATVLALQTRANELMAAATAEPEGDQVSELDVQEAERAAQGARDRRLNGALLAKAWKDLKDADDAERDGRVLARESMRFREAADGCDSILSDAIAKVAPRGLRVHGGRLCVQTARGLTVFDQLSHGERWRIALDVAIDAVGEGGILVIEQEAWEGLDPENRSSVSNHARARRTVIVTAEAREGELRAEVYQ